MKPITFHSRCDLAKLTKTNREKLKLYADEELHVTIVAAVRELNPHYSISRELLNVFIPQASVILALLLKIGKFCNGKC